MGLGRSTGSHIKPIYSQLYEQGLVEFNEFTLCLGKNGGKFMIGKFDKQNFFKIAMKSLSQEVELIALYFTLTIL